MKFPYVNLDTKEIKNCSKGSKIWWHEKGHLEFDKLNSTRVFRIYQHIALLFWMLTISLSLLNKYMLFLAIPLCLFYIGVDVYEEIWCNNFARRNYNG